mmetsp:Transcript_89729/g.159486  ORF Transcript_89729/g.159486 Transcript_89729/m.159486 type:complete len:289 (+) Transcript_89729:27-893(+)
MAHDALRQSNSEGEEVLDLNFCAECGTESYLDNLQCDGYCILSSFLRRHHLEEIRDAFDSRMQHLLADNMEVDLGVNWSETSAEPFLRTLLDERLLRLLGEICGLPFVAMRLELFEKMPGSKTIIPWHQDTYTTHVGFKWTAEDAAAGARPHPITLWVALDDATAETGGMQMVPGRHHELIGGVVPPLAILDAAVHGEAFEYKLAPGQAGLHHPLTPHRSLPNLSRHRRRAFLVRFVPWSASLERSRSHELRTWSSRPCGHFQWQAFDEASLAPGRSLNRLLVCSKTE